jgi:GLPGLI family protein
MLKRLFIGLILLVAYTIGFAQQKTVERAIVKSKTEITFPQNVNRNAGGDDDGNATFGGAGGMESKSTVYFKGDLIKTYNESDFGNTTVIVDKKNKRTTTLREAMGRKTGFYSTEEDEAAMRKNMQARRDSIRQARGQSVSNTNATIPEAEIVATNETKKIAGYNCKKAIIKTKSRQGEVNETIVWYTPDFKMAQGYPVAGNTGGGFGRGMRGQRGGFGIAGLDKIDGFIMGYDVSRSNGFEMHMEVTKAELDPAIDDKIFEIPKGYDIKPLSEMQEQFRGVRITQEENN